MYINKKGLISKLILKLQAHTQVYYGITVNKKKFNKT